MNVFYKNTAYGTIQSARISEVHPDDAEPYYSIRLMDDSREKQTDNAHVRLILKEGGEDDSDEEGMTACCISCLLCC